MLKRLFSIIAISLILTGVFFNSSNINCPVYADSTTDSWQNVTSNEQLVEAFRYYCKSRDLTIDGSVADGVTRFTTSAFNGICNTLGINVTALQAQIKYQTDGNTGTRFLFSSLGIDAYNRIFAQFLQDNDVDVGDSVNKIISSRLWWEDDYHNGCYCLITNGGSTQSKFVKGGSAYRNMDYHYFEPLKETQTQSMSLLYKGNSYTYYRITENTGSSSYRSCLSTTTNYSVNIALFKEGNEQQSGILGYVTVRYEETNQKYYFGYVTALGNSFYQLFELTDASGIDENVYITTNNTVINNNVYEGNTVINNNGDTINNYPDPETPETPDPPDPPTLPDDGGWKDFSLPEMPNDWLIYGMEKKFPFDIPFNILFGLSLLNHEPEIPKFEGDIDLKVCNWHYDIDLTPFDDIAKMLRKFEVLAFIIGLAMLTKELIMWG